MILQYFPLSATLRFLRFVRYDRIRQLSPLLGEFGSLDHGVHSRPTETIAERYKVRASDLLFGNAVREMCFAGNFVASTALSRGIGGGLEAETG